MQWRGMAMAAELDGFGDVRIGTGDCLDDGLRELATRRLQTPVTYGWKRRAE
jgi:hypothetical protein